MIICPPSSQAIRGGQSSSPWAEHVPGDRVPEGQPGGVQGAPVHPHGLSQVGPQLTWRLPSLPCWSGPPSLKGRKVVREEQLPPVGRQRRSSLAGSWDALSFIVCSSCCARMSSVGPRGRDARPEGKAWWSVPVASPPEPEMRQPSCVSERLECPGRR